MDQAEAWRRLRLQSEVPLNFVEVEPGKMAFWDARCNSLEMTRVIMDHFKQQRLYDQEHAPDTKAVWRHAKNDTQLFFGDLLVYDSKRNVRVFKRDWLAEARRLQLANQGTSARVLTIMIQNGLNELSKDRNFDYLLYSRAKVKGCPAYKIWRRAKRHGVRATDSSDVEDDGRDREEPGEEGK